MLLKLPDLPLSRRVSLCGRSMIIDIATTYGRQMLSTIICGALDYLGTDESWFGNISIKDLMLAEYSSGKRLIITKKASVKGNATPEEKLDDLWAIWRAIQPFYLVGGSLPLYFKRLQRDLLNATELDDSFVEYLRYHPAYYASNPRKNLITGFHLVSCKSKIPLTNGLPLVFKCSPFGTDWRWKIPGSEVLESIYSYRERERKEKGKEKERKEEVEQEKGKVEAGREKSAADQYLNTLVSLLVFQRNGLQHPFDHAVMSNKDEMELLLAAVFEDFLPDLIKILLRVCNMGGEYVS